MILSGVSIVKEAKMILFTETAAEIRLYISQDTDIIKV